MTVVTKLDTRVLDSMIAKNPAKASQIVRSTAFEVEGQAKVRAPVDTSALQNSIHAEMISQLVARISDGVEYGIYQELGFHHWKSGIFIQNPFMVPAVEAVRPDWDRKWNNFLKR